MLVSLLSLLSYVSRLLTPVSIMVRERTFIAVKPDGVQRGLIGEIIKRFESKGFKLAGMKFMQATEDHLKKHYADLADKPFYPGLCKYMSSGPLVAMCWEGTGVVKTARTMMGETRPADSKPGTIRGDFCIEVGRLMEFFGDVTTACGLEILNDFLQDRSYIRGFTPSQIDAEVFSSLVKAPEDNFSHALRWYNHIQSLNIELKLTLGESLAATTDFLQNAKLHDVKVVNESDTFLEEREMAEEMSDGSQMDNEDDEFDLFGSDDDDDQEVAKLRDERLKAYAEKKSKKPGPIAKSSIMLDVKPWDDETDMITMEELVRSIRMDGLQWGASKLAPLAFGINKLSILCTVEDEKVSVDDLIERICDFEDAVQSVDIAAFNKI